MLSRIPLDTWIEQFRKGKFESPDVETQIDAGWYDWFCKDSSLALKTKNMGNIIKSIKDGGKISLSKSYVWFKNNCPLNGSLYDDFIIANIETGDVQFTIQVDCCWNNHKYSVYGRTSDGVGHWDIPLFESNSKRELIKWLNIGWSD